MTRDSAFRTEFIQSKVNPPQAPDKIIDRKLSSFDLARSDATRIVLLQAPAGYGKTTWMVSQWRSLRARGMPTAWLTLDSGDDRETLMKYLSEALFSVIGKATNVLHRNDGIHSSGGLSGLLHTLRNLREPLTLFLDDVETLSDATALGELDELIENLPSRHTLVLATRTKPKLRLARFRIHGAVVDIGTAQLEFDGENVARYLRDGGLTWLDDDGARAVVARTEGWPVAVELASRFINSAEDINKIFVGGSDPIATLYDYLAEEIFSLLSELVQDFLLRTSVLRNLHPRLCNAMLERSDSQQIIDDLLDHNIFLTRTGAGEWLRFHSLFRGMLQRQFERAYGGDVKQMHKRAAKALADMDLFNQAIDHAIASEDVEFVETFIAGPGQVAIQRGAAARIATWARQQPVHYLARRHDVLVVTAWAHLLVRDVERAKAEVEVLVERRSAGMLGEPECRGLAVLETMFAIMTGLFSNGLALSNEHLNGLAKTSTFERGVISNVSGYAEILMSRFEDAEAHLSDGLVNHVAAESTFGQAFSIAYRGLLEAVQGRFGAALRIYKQADELEQGFSDSPSRAVVYAFASDVLLEQNRLAETREKIRFSLSLASEFAYCGIVSLSHFTMTRLLAAEGDFSAAIRFADDAIEEGLRRDFPRLVRNMHWERVRLFLLCEDNVEARRYAQRIPTITTIDQPDSVLFYPDELEATDIGAIRLMVHEGSYDEALHLIETAVKRADAMRRVWRASKLRVLRCLALDGRGETKTAMRRLHELIRSTARERFVRTYLDEGPAATALIARIREQLDETLSSSSSNTLANDLDALMIQAPPAPAINPHVGALELLTEREAAILTCLGKGLTNKQIATRLFLTENTVKWHLRNIYQKLGVGNRTGAIATLHGTRFAAT